MFIHKKLNSMTNKTKMQLTSETGTEFWNDSCSIIELSDAVSQGAVGATSNPLIVYNVISQEKEIWKETLMDIIKNNPSDSEDDIAWKLIETIGIKAAKVLEGVYKEHNGKKGRLSLQVNPMHFRSTAKMVEHAKHLSSLAPNIAIKAPCVSAGLDAIEEMTALGICVNVTVSFSVAQVILAAERIERGLDRAKANGINTDNFTPYVTMMVGRLDDQLKRVMAKERISIDPGYLEWAGVAAFKKAYKLFKERGYRSKLLVAAFRNHMQWSEFIGGDLVLSMPHEWWTQYNNSDIEVIPRIDIPVRPEIIEELYRKFADFRKAYDEDGMTESEFLTFGSTVHTLNQFNTGYQNLLTFIRERILL